MSHLEVFFTDFKRIRYVWSAARVPSLGFLVTRAYIFTDMHAEPAYDIIAIITYLLSYLLTCSVRCYSYALRRCCRILASKKMYLRRAAYIMCRYMNSSALQSWK